MEKLLPIGSVVLLKGGNKRVMIYGRKQIQPDKDKVWDYIACPYPEGNVSPEYTVLFDHEIIEKVFFIGFQDIEELQFNEQLQGLNKKADENELELEDKGSKSSLDGSLSSFREVLDEYYKNALENISIEKGNEPGNCEVNFSSEVKASGIVKN